MSHPYLSGTAHPRVLAHRGLVTPELAAGGAVENSLAAVRAAVDAGAEYVETDCHLTRDGRVVLMHDADLHRVADDPRPVAAVTHRELAGLMATRGGLLTLEEALETFRGTRFNVDVKALAAAESAGRIVAAHAERVLLTSFSDTHRRVALDAASAARGQRPATAPGRGGILGVLRAMHLGTRAARQRAFDGIDALQIPERRGRLRLLTRRLIEVAHAHGVEVHVWTVNDVETMRRLITMGVDGVITDRADDALDALR